MRVDYSLESSFFSDLVRDRKICNVSYTTSSRFSDNFTKFRAKIRGRFGRFKFYLILKLFNNKSVRFPLKYFGRFNFELDSFKSCPKAICSCKSNLEHFFMLNFWKFYIFRPCSYPDVKAC